MTTIAFAGTAFGLCHAILPSQTTQVLTLHGRSVSAGQVVGSIGETAAAAGVALAAGFAATADVMRGMSPTFLPDRLGTIVEVKPAAVNGTLTQERVAQLALAIRRAGRHPTRGTDGKPRTVAALDLSPEPPPSLAWMIGSLAGAAGFLTSMSASVGMEARRRGRRRSTRSRWECPADLVTARVSAQLAATSPAIEAAVILDEPQPASAADADIRTRPLLDADPIHRASLAPLEDLLRTFAADTAGVRLRANDLADEFSLPSASKTNDVSVYRQAPEPMPNVLPVALPAPVSAQPKATIHDFPAAAPVVSPVDAYDLAESAISIGLRTLLIVEAGSARRSCGCVDLVRALAGLGSSSILLDLGFDRLIARDLGIEESALGLSHLLTGSADLSEIVHKDVASAADAIVWGRDGAAEPIRREGLADLFVSLSRIYDCVVIAGGSSSLRHLAGLLGQDGAAVLSLSSDGDDLVALRMAELAACGRSDPLVMMPYPRDHDRIAEAA